MGEIESPLGKRTFETTGMRHYTVDDASASDGDGDGENHRENNNTPLEPAQQRMTYEEAMALRQQRIAEVSGGGGNRASSSSDAAKRRIEMLIGIGRQTRDVSIESENGPVVFSMRTLKSKEMRQIMQIAAEMAKAEVIDTPYAIRERTLALAIFAIDGIDIDIVLDVSGRPLQERIATRTMLLDEMNEYTLNHLYHEHESMMEENSKLFGVKSSEDAKEVATQIKKSGKGA